MKKWKYSKNFEQSLPQQQSFLKNKKTILLLGIGIIILMIGSVLTLFTPQEEALTYNNYNFFQSPTGWATNINGQQLSFEHLPKDLEDIQTEPFTLPQKKVYILFNPADTDEQSYELQRLKAFLFYLGKTPAPACTQEEACSDLPLLTCQDNAQIVYLKYGNESNIHHQDYCLVLQTDQDPSKVITRFLYTLLGVMP